MLLLNLLGRIALGITVVSVLLAACWIALCEWRRWLSRRRREAQDARMIPRTADLWQIDPPLCPGCSQRLMVPVVIAAISSQAAIWRCTSCRIDLHRFIDGSRGRAAVEAYLAEHEMESA